MTAVATSPESKRPRAPTLYIIIGFKVLKGLGALLLALGMYSLSDKNLPDEFQKLLLFLHQDPEKKLFADLGDRVAEITPSNLHWVAIFSIIYGLFMMLQAVGLIFRVSWIVWLVIGESAFFVPVEIFELVHKPNWIKLSIIMANILIVWYLFANRERLIKHHD